MTRLPYDAVIFDLDGTLTESEPGITKSVQYSLDVLGYGKCDEQTLKSFIGPPLFDSYVNVLGMDEDKAREGIRLYRERFSTVGLFENAVYMGIPLLLRSLKAHGAYLAIATSKPQLFAEKILRHFGLYQYFDRVVAASPNDETSEKPALVRRALPKSYGRACMVGDRSFDCEGALANGIDCIGALYGYGSEDELRQAGAAHIARDVPHLTELLLGGLPTARGLFITLEGSDGCGKSTQVQPLIEWLRQCGHDVLPTREPGGCPISERIRRVVLDPAEKGMSDLTEALLFAASRAQHVQDTILPAVHAGRTVVCDRYVDSSIAYQGAGRGLGVELVASLNAPGVAGCMPDLTILFDLDPIEGIRRRTQAEAPDRIEAADEAFIKRTYDYYRQLAQKEPERVRVFDASGAPGEVGERLRGFIAPLL